LTDVSLTRLSPGQQTPTILISIPAEQHVALRVDESNLYANHFNLDDFVTLMRLAVQFHKVLADSNGICPFHQIVSAPKLDIVVYFWYTLHYINKETRLNG
jgi:hypothetical protein